MNTQLLNDKIKTIKHFNTNILLEEIINNNNVDCKIKWKNIVDILLQDMNFTIRYKNNENITKCPKTILYLIPYFEFSLCIDTFDIEVNIDYCYMNLILEILYSNDPYKLFNDKTYMRLFVTMDFLLMVDHFNILLAYGITGHMRNILMDDLDNKNFDVVVSFYKILKNITKSSDDRFIVTNANVLFRTFVNCDIWDGDIFIFDNWYEIFDSGQQLRGIVMSEKYELFNISTIRPHIIIKRLLQNNLINNIDMTYNIINNKNNKVINSSTHVISSYYPILTYTTYRTFLTFSVIVKDNTIEFFTLYSIDINIYNNVVFNSFFGDNNEIYQVVEICNIGHGRHKIKFNKNIICNNIYQILKVSNYEIKIEL